MKKKKKVLFLAVCRTYSSAAVHSNRIVHFYSTLSFQGQDYEKLCCVSVLDLKVLLLQIRRNIR